MDFKLKIKLGNEAMQNGHDIAGALRKIAVVVGDYNEVSPGMGGGIRDLNGNTVGEWEVTGARKRSSRSGSVKRGRSRRSRR